MKPYLLKLDQKCLEHVQSTSLASSTFKTNEGQWAINGLLLLSCCDVWWILNNPKEKKTLDKAMVEKVKENKWKEREEKQTKQTINLWTTTKWAKCKVANKWARGRFLALWFATTIKEVGNPFHQYYVTSFRAPLRY